jgi:hypothetical protein
MLIRLVKHWNGFKPGRRFEMADGAANVLIKRGFAKQTRPTKRASKK